MAISYVNIEPLTVIKYRHAHENVTRHNSFLTTVDMLISHVATHGYTTAQRGNYHHQMIDSPESTSTFPVCHTHEPYPDTSLD